MTDEETPTDAPHARRKATRERFYVLGFMFVCLVCGAALAVWVTR